MIRALTFVGLTASLAVGLPYGSAGAQEHAELELVPLLGSVVNFLILVGILVLLGRKPLSQYLKQRRSAIEEALAEAMRLRMEAEAKKKEYAEKLAHLSEEMATIRREIQTAGEAERDRMAAETEAKVARAQRETDFLIEQQLKQLRIDLTREVVDAAVSAAAEVLQKGVSTQDQERLGVAYLEDLRRSSFGADRALSALSQRPPQRPTTEGHP